MITTHLGELKTYAFHNDRAENAKLVKKDPKHFCSPAYMGPRGWLGIRLDTKGVDWKELAARVDASYRLVAPKRLLKLIEQ